MRIIIASPLSVAQASAEPAMAVYSQGKVLAEKPVILVAPALQKLFAGVVDNDKLDRVVSEWSGVTTKVYMVENAVSVESGISQFSYASPNDEKGEQDARLFFPEQF